MPNTREKLIELPEKSLNYDGTNREMRFTGGDVTPVIANGVTFAKDNNVPSKWIPVSERLPEENGIYLTFNKKRQYEFHMFQTGKRMWQGIWEEDGVTHWRPLPQPPKGE